MFVEDGSFGPAFEVFAFVLDAGIVLGVVSAVVAKLRGGQDVRSDYTAPNRTPWSPQIPQVLFSGSIP